jgi:hypothetical protein
MVQDMPLTRAVAAIPQRSERQQDLQKLLGSFVDVGILPQIRNVNNQIIYGRRGTGKTHVLSVLASELRNNLSNIVLYVDARTLGSTSQFTDISIPMRGRCIALFRDILGEIYNTLLDHIVNVPPSRADFVLDQLSDLGRLATDAVVTYSANTVTAKSADKTVDKAGFSISATARPELSLSSSNASERQLETEQLASYSARIEDKVIFPALNSLLKIILHECGCQLFLLIDEWSSLPIDIQPYLAEFLKRGLLPLAEVVVKIASLEYRSKFAVESKWGAIGFEVGADVSAAIDIDDYYVYDRNPTRITEAFADMLYKHIQTELPANYLTTTYAVSGGATLTNGLFSDRSVFQELVRGSEGVARDLINIFNHAYFSAHRRGKERIDKAAVTEAARLWFEQDKMRNLDDELQKTLRRIVEEVIGKRKARSFLLPRELGGHAVIQRLVDLRVLHLLQRGYADKDKPGVRYDIYTLDYGTYVDLMNTSRRPDMGFAMSGDRDDGETVVPFDDKRSIRRIVLTQDVLEPKEGTLF